MEKIGRQVHFIPASDGNSRNGEGSFIRLKNGDIMLGYTEFISDSREDEDEARICAVISRDEGESWGEKKVLFEKSNGAVNIMSLSFLAMENGDIGAFYIEKAPDGSDKIMLSRSADDGNSWSNPVNCIEGITPSDYYVLNNDRVIRLKSGRILFALARHSNINGFDSLEPGKICFFYSDNDGESWSKAPAELASPFKNDKIGFQEPGLYELPDGKIWCYIRTSLGFQYESFSADGGESWSEAEPNIFFSSPASPMLAKSFRDLTVAVFNPVPEHILRDDDEEFWGRTPYTIAVKPSCDASFSKEGLFFLEDDLSNGYCYPAIFEGEDYILIAYYHSNNTDCCLNSTKVIKIGYNELI